MSRFAVALSSIFFLLFMTLSHGAKKMPFQEVKLTQAEYANLLSDCDNVFLDYPQSKQYACHTNQSESDRFLTELLADGRENYVISFLYLLSNVNVSDVSMEDKDTLVLKALHLLYNQTYTNPPQYVSHGTDHSVRVMNWCINLLTIDEVVQGLEKNYHLSGDKAKLVLGLLGLMHDIGYADLDMHKVPKWLHAISSGIMTNYFLNEWTNGIGARLLNGLGAGNIVQDFVEAIGQHNWDESFCKWTNNNDQYWKQCTFNTSGDPNDPLSRTTPILNGNTTWIRRYSYGHAIESPFKFVVRVADNLDAVRSRLTPVQNDEKMMKYFYRLYVDQPLREAVGSGQDLEKVRAEARERAQTYAGVVHPTPDQQKVMERADEQSFLHFFSNYIVEGSEIDPNIWSVYVILYEINGDLSFPLHVGAGLYQINRLATSALSCILRGNSTFLDLVRFNFNIPIPGLDGANFLPLRAFTKKPVYEKNGIEKYPDGSEAEICDPFCESTTVALTQSYEPCLLPSGDQETKEKSSVSNEKFSKIPPFTDLTYLPVVNPNPTPEKKEDKKLSTALIIVGVIAGILLLLNIIFLFKILSKKKAGYEPLQ